MPDKRWYLFTIFGNKVYMTASFLLIMVFFVGMGVRTAEELLVGLLWIPVLFIGILWHELGHALMSRQLGFGNSKIVFWGMGGLAINEYSGRRSPKKGIAISLAGPAASLLLAGISWGVLYAVQGGMAATGMLTQFLSLMFTVNLFWAIFNMLPIYPMDGGQAMREGLKIGLKSTSKANKTTGIISIVTIVLTLGASMVLFNTTGIFLLFLAAYFAYLNWNLIQSGRTQRWAG